MILKTFNEWSREGYTIRKGSRHVGRTNAGTPLFSEDQVYMRQRYSYGGFIAKDGYGNWNDSGMNDWDEDCDFRYY
jgi:hypothetical protein